MIAMEREVGSRRCMIGSRRGCMVGSRHCGCCCRIGSRPKDLQDTMDPLPPDRTTAATPRSEPFQCRTEPRWVVVAKTRHVAVNWPDDSRGRRLPGRRGKLAVQVVVVLHPPMQEVAAVDPQR